MASDEIAESSAEGEDPAVLSEEEHRGVAEEHGDQEVEVGGEAEREVGEDGAGDRRV